MSDWQPAKRYMMVSLLLQSDVMGECETKYMVNSDSNTTSTGPKTILVTAIRNFDNCVKKPHYIEGIFAGVYMDHNEKVEIIDLWFILLYAVARKLHCFWIATNFLIIVRKTRQA